jgi:hypothetical protein
MRGKKAVFAVTYRGFNLLDAYLVLEGNRESMQRSNDGSRLLQVLVEFFGPSERAVHKYLCQAIGLREAS